MFTRTSINAVVLAKVGEAIRVAAYNSRLWSAACGHTIAGKAYVENAKGARTLRVEHRRGEPQAIRVLDARGRDVTRVVLAALRGAGHGVRNA